MVQEIISLIIVGGAIIYVFYVAIKFLIPGRNKKTKGNCGGGACHCKPEMVANSGKHQHKNSPGQYKHMHLY